MTAQDQRRSRPTIHFSVLLQTEPSDCGSCGQPTAPGLVGWYRGKADGPLCIGCLLENDPDLGSVVATVQLVREVGAKLRSGSPAESAETKRLLNQFAVHFERFAASRWPRQPLDFLEILKMAFVPVVVEEEDVN